MRSFFAKVCDSFLFFQKAISSMCDKRCSRGCRKGLLLKSIITHSEERYSVVERKKKRGVSMQDVPRHYGDALGAFG